MHRFRRRQRHRFDTGRVPGAHVELARTWIPFIGRHMSRAFPSEPDRHRQAPQFVAGSRYEAKRLGKPAPMFPNEVPAGVSIAQVLKQMPRPPDDEAPAA